MGRVVSPLRQMGADIRAREDNFAPLEIRPAKLRAIHYKMPMASAQVKSAVLLAGLFADGLTSVTEPARTRDHTELALEEFGIDVEKHGSTIQIRGSGGNGGGKLQARSLDVPGDISSAVFFIAAASMFPDSNLLIHNVGLNPTRTAILDVFASMGAALQSGVPAKRAWRSCWRLVGERHVAQRRDRREGTDTPGDRRTADAGRARAIYRRRESRSATPRNCASKRVIASPRSLKILRRMGATVDERPDGLRVEGRKAGKLRGAEIDPHGDHRIAMAFAVAGLAAEGATTIRDADCAGVSYPNFYEDLERVAER